MPTCFSLTELAERYECSPKVFSDFFFRRVLDPGKCIVKAGRKLVPESYLPAVERELRRTGRLD